LLKEGFKPLKEEEKEWKCEIGKELGLGRSLKVGVVYPTGNSTDFLVTTVYEEKGFEGMSDYSLIKEGKEFPLSTPTKEIIEYINSKGPTEVEF